MNRLFCFFCLAIAAWSAMAVPVAADNLTWIGDVSREFGDPLNWDPDWYGGPDTMRIDDSSDTTSPLLYFDLSANVNLNELYLGSLTAPHLPATTTGGKLTIQEGGALPVNGMIDVGVVGPVAGDNTLVLEGGTVIEGGSTGGRIVQGAAVFRIGVLNNSGSVNMSGGSRIDHLNGGEFVIGAMANGVGTVNMSGQSILALRSTPLKIGAYPSAGGTATGTLNMADNSYLGVSESNTLYAGYGAGTKGTVHMEDSANIGWFAGSMFFGREGGEGKLEMFGSSHIYQNWGEMDFGYLGGSKGELVMTGSGTVQGEFPSIQQRGVTFIGRDGGVGTVAITNATYWSEFTSVYVGIGPAGDAKMTVETTPDSVNQGTLVVNGNLEVGWESSQGELNIQGNSNVVVNGNLTAGHWTGQTAPTATGIINMSGGGITVNRPEGSATYVRLGTGGNGTWNQTGGVATMNGPTVLGEHSDATGGGTGTLNLDGGIYSTSRIYLGWGGVGNAHGRINFDGGTLKVNPDGWEFIPNGAFVELRSATDMVITVEGGGAIIDTTGQNVGIGVPLSHDATLGDQLDGGLTKIGEGLLHLPVSPTYNGNTTIEAGWILTPSINTPLATISVKGDASLVATSLVADTLSIGGTPLTAAVPEPSTLILLGMAVLGCGAMIWRKK